MDKLEMLGFLLQDLRDNHDDDEEDIGAELLRETTRIYALVVKYGHISRDMFDLAGICDPHECDPLPLQYAVYNSTNYPACFVAFAYWFADWLTGKDGPDTLDVLELIQMIKQYSWLRIQVSAQETGTRITVRSPKFSPRNFRSYVFIAA